MLPDGRLSATLMRAAMGEGPEWEAGGASGGVGVWCRGDMEVEEGRPAL